MGNLGKNGPHEEIAAAPEFQGDTSHFAARIGQKIPEFLPRTKFQDNLNDYQIDSVFVEKIWPESRNKEDDLIRLRKKD